jgi:acyl carrier protein
MEIAMNKKKIELNLLNYFYETNALAVANKPLPQDQSLYDLGILDSLGVMELVEFIEKNWNIVIDDEEIIRQNIGGIDRMTNFILIKLEKLEN